MHPRHVSPLLLFLLVTGAGLAGDAGGSTAAWRAPRPGSSSNRERRCSPSPALPAYMVSLYRGALFREDVIRSLRPQSVHQVGQEWSIIFDFSTSQQEELHLAELRLYLSRPGRKTPVHDPVSVNLFHQQEATCQKGYSCPHIVHVGSFAVSPSFPSKWIALEVTDELSMWFTNSSSADKSFQKVLTQTKWHTKNLLKRVTSHCRSIDRKAFLVLFSSFSKGKKDLSSSSLLQTVKGSKYFIQGTPKDVIPLWGTKRHRRHEELEFRHLCQRVDFYVDFDEIGWGSWIVHPKQYNAFRCEGKCPVPLEEAFQPTNHAYMQSLLKHYHPEQVPAACCIPVRLSPLSLLYYEGGRVNIGHHEDMVVEECGCR
ncbi:nodal homolog isoform X3 [Hemicordylus capensis]|uniref:nodal homolog isoform X3 n=1 Tax=Hemicordylus capensis TaxID=884348 RepID=UPI0023034ED5|nr:nodal homolog isoform X3 [Hemicordylus capensis]